MSNQVSRLGTRRQETLSINMRWLGMNTPFNPSLTLNPGPIPGLPADHTHLRLMVPRVLVVEDEMTVALLIEDMVTELAYEVAAVVPRLDDAMRLLDSDSFDLAMLDVHLNGKTVFPFAVSMPDWTRAMPFWTSSRSLVIRSSAA